MLCCQIVRLATDRHTSLQLKVDEDSHSVLFHWSYSWELQNLWRTSNWNAPKLCAGMPPGIDECKRPKG